MLLFPQMRTLLAIAVVFVLAGCASEAPPLPDIDATVEARLELAKASLVAPTAVPLPTYTPMPVPSPEVADVPEFSKGEKIAYVSTMHAVYVMNPDGSNPTKVIEDKNLKNWVNEGHPNTAYRRYYSFLCWSNDNSKLVYISENEDKLTRHLIIVDIDGTNKVTLDINSLPLEGLMPKIRGELVQYAYLSPRCWHPTEDKILLAVGDANGQPNLYQVTTDGKEAKLLNSRYPSVGRISGYSPQGEKISLIAPIGVPRTHIFDLGGNNHESYPGRCMSWSSDTGALLCYQGSTIVTYNPSGTPYILKEHQKGYSIMYAGWSHDGSKILYTEVDENNNDCAIYTINSDGTGKKKLLHEPGACAAVYSNR